MPGGDLREHIGGSGPPMLLLHGNPQTHMIRHAIAPALAARCTVVCAHLRGYGGSFKPGPGGGSRSRILAPDGASSDAGGPTRSVYRALSPPKP